MRITQQSIEVMGAVVKRIADIGILIAVLQISPPQIKECNFKWQAVKSTLYTPQTAR